MCVAVLRPLRQGCGTKSVPVKFVVGTPDLKFSKRVGGSSETEGRDGALGLGVDGQVMIWCCSSSCGLSTSFYLDVIGRNANELKRI